MTSAKILQAEKMGEVRFNMETLLKTFFERLTVEQWGLLKACTLDYTTKILISELLLDIIRTLSKYFLTADKTKNMSKQKIKESLGDLVTDIFKTVLDVDDRGRCRSSGPLRDMINAEVAANVNSALSNSELRVSQYITPSYSLNTMVHHTTQMSSKLMLKMKRKLGQKQGRPSQDLELVDVAESDIESSVNSIEQLENVEKIPSQLDSPQMIIERELNEITDPLLDEMPVSEFQCLQSDSSRDETAFSGIIEEMQESPRAAKISQGRKAKSFITRHFAKTLLNRTLYELKTKFQVPAGKNGPIMMSEVEYILCTLLESYDGTLQAGKDGRASKTTKGLPRAEQLVTIAKDVSDLLLTHIAQDLPAKIVPGPSGAGGNKWVSRVPHSCAEMYPVIWDKVWLFIGLLDWWHQTQIDVLFQKIRSNYLTAKAVVDINMKARRKIAVEVIVEKLVFVMFKELNLNKAFVDPTVLVQLLFEETWRRVDDIQFDINSETFKDVQHIYNKMKWVLGPEKILILLKAGQEGIVYDIAFAIRCHLQGKGKTTRMARFSAYLRRGVTELFTLRETLSVV